MACDSALSRCFYREAATQVARVVCGWVLYFINDKHKALDSLTSPGVLSQSRVTNMTSPNSKKIMEALPLMDVAGLAGRVEYNRPGSSSLFDTAIHQTLSQMESLRVGTDGLVSLPEVGDSSSFDLSNGRARIIFAQCDQLRQVHGATCPGSIPFKHRTFHSSGGFPFSPTTLEDIISKMSLPTGTAESLSYTPLTYLCDHFQVYDPRGDRQRTGITMKLPDSAIVGTSFSVSLSHCHETNTTESLILCNSKKNTKNYLNQLAQSIDAARPLCGHPASIPLLILGLFADILDEKIEATWLETFKLETESGQTGILLAADGTRITTGNHLKEPTQTNDRVHINGPKPVPSQDREAQLGLNQISIGLAQLALAWEIYSQVVVALLGHVQEFLKSPLCNDGTGVQQDQTFALKERVISLNQRAAGLVRRAGYLRARLELQNTAVNSLLALDLGRTSRSEATSMKYLALVGLVFLPATSIAAIYTIPVEFGDKYWVTTALVTVFLMGACVLAVKLKWKPMDKDASNMA